MEQRTLIERVLLERIPRSGIGSALHGRPWLPSHLSTLTNKIGLPLDMRPVDASALAGPQGICGLMPDYPDGL
jgi:hypothetical protein